MDSTSAVRRAVTETIEVMPVIEETVLGEDVRLLTISGELDISTVESVRDRLLAAAKAPARGLVVDLTAVSFLDSVTLAALVRVRHEIASRGRLIVVIAPASFPALVFDAAGLTEHFEIVATAEQAAALLAA